MLGIRAKVAGLLDRLIDRSARTTPAPRAGYALEEVAFEPLAEPVEKFSCGDQDLDEFLVKDALRLQEHGVVRVYLALRERECVGYVALLCDVLRTKSNERRRLKLSHTDHPAIPAMKVARLGVDKTFRETYAGLGTALMRLAFDVAICTAELTGCRLLTVDAYPSAVGFYEKLGFIRNKIEGNGEAVSMRFDLQSPDLPAWAGYGDERIQELDAAGRSGSHSGPSVDSPPQPMAAAATPAPIRPK